VAAGYLIGLSCWLIANQLAADASPIKGAVESEVEEREQRRSLAVC